MKNHTIVFYTSALPAKRANGIYLICAWQLLYLKRTPEESYRGFQRDRDLPRGNCLSANHSSKPPKVPSTTVCALPPWHDASPCVCTYDLTVMDCLRGLSKARACGFFDFETFHVEEYEHFEQVEVSTVDPPFLFFFPFFHHNLFVLMTPPQQYHYQYQFRMGT